MVSALLLDFKHLLTLSGMRFHLWYGARTSHASKSGHELICVQLSHSIKADMHLSQNQIANSNIIALTATLLIRAIAGPMCDAIGPRLTFASLLFIGSIPTALAGTAHNAMGLYFIRFFVGILGGTFVPCQVWSTGFFDKNVVGTSNALVGGWGNSGGGIT